MSSMPKMSLSGLLRPEQFSLDGEESTIKCLLAQPPFWISRRYWKLRNGLSRLFIFACGSSAGPYTPEFVDAQSFSYPVCPNQKVTVIFGLVPILPPNVISHTLLPIAALNRQSLWWGQACFRIPWEPQCQVVTTLGLETEKAVIWAWLAPSLWVIVETLSPDATERAGLLMSSSVRWDPDPLTS